MTRRMNHYAVPEWHKWLAVALIGALFIAAGIAAMIIQFAFSIRDRESQPGPHRRPVKWPQPGVVNGIAGTVLQLRACAGNYVPGAALGQQKSQARLRPAA
jgi:heme/copper-type cytochrome/quinol oxidase subunit 1